MILFTAIPALFSYVLLRLQPHLPLNPQGLPTVRPDLAFNTAVSFSTNTNWQSYGGESTMSYFSQMVSLVVHNFIIFNAVIIVFLIPLALRGVKFKALSAGEVLQRNLFVYGLGGLIVPFVGIKAIDLVVYNLLHLV
jgi:K+-transporting ATPase A subunit